MRKRATIHDVAAHAGVSYQTVSRLLNGHPMVSERARHRIQQAMIELDYMPSGPARSLKAGRTTVLGVVVPDGINPFFSTMVRGIEDTAYAAGYCVMVCSSILGTRETEYLQLLYRHRVAGILVVPVVADSGPSPALSRARVPLVSLDQRVPGVDSVLLDNVAAAAQAVDHLVALGHRRIGMVTGPLSTTSGRGRLIGYRRALRRAGLPLDPSLQASGPYTEEAAAAAARAMLMRPDHPSALLAANNTLAIGVMAAVASVGLRIPDDVALVGFDELSWNPALVAPVTTMVQPSYAMGAEACRLLFDRLLGGYTGSARRLYLPAHLVVRQSCGSPLAEADRLPLLQFAFGP